MKVLIADDDSEDVELFQGALAEVNPEARLIVAANGMQALETVKTERPEVIFLDINMPLMSGWECLQAIKEDETLRDIPVIIFTTSSSPRDIEIAFNLGAACLLTKPDRYGDLKTFLSEVTHALATDRVDTLRENPLLKRRVHH